MANSDEHLSKEALKLIHQYQDQLSTAPYESHISERQIIEYRQAYDKLMAKLTVDDILPNDKSLSFKHNISKPYLTVGDVL